MYQDHFGLTGTLFPAVAVGDAVFVGPQFVQSASAVQRALATRDAVVTISGSAGAGKSTVARRAIDSVSAKRGIVTIGRISLGPDEVLELLLAGLGAQTMPKSTVQRFGAFRRLLDTCEQQDTRVYVAVEDATRIGVDTLCELEAVTAVDAGISKGANLILMGNDQLRDMLRDPKLARLKQRIRLRHELQPMSVGEVRGYLKHSCRKAGGDFDVMFEAGCAEALHGFSGGIARVVNTLVEAAMTQAAEQGVTQVSVAMISHVAAEELGLTVEHSLEEIQAALTSAPIQSEPEPEPAPEPEPEPEPVADELELPVETPAEPVVDAQPELEPEAVTEDASAVAESNAPAGADADDDIPEFIQDTLPDLEVLAPDLAAQAVEIETPAEPSAGAVAHANESATDTEDESDPAAGWTQVTPAPTGMFDAASSEENAIPAEARDENGEIPAWDRDPTLAELRPDLDALERAMAVAQGIAKDPDADEVEAEAAPSEPVDEEIPEITLDRQIQAKIDEATEAIRKSEEEVAKHAEEDGERKTNTHFEEPPEEQTIPELTNPELTNAAELATPIPPDPQPDTEAAAEPILAPDPAPETDMLPELTPEPIAATMPEPELPTAPQPQSVEDQFESTAAAPVLMEEPILAFDAPVAPTTAAEAASVAEPTEEPAPLPVVESESLPVVEPEPMPAAELSVDTLPELAPETVIESATDTEPQVSVTDEATIDAPSFDEADLDVSQTETSEIADLGEFVLEPAAEAPVVAEPDIATNAESDTIEESSFELTLDPTGSHAAPGNAELTDSDEAGAADEGAVSEPFEMNLDAPAANAPDVNKLASQFATAKTLDDVDDLMAETLFGEEIDLIAAELAANSSNAAPLMNTQQLQAQVAPGIPAGDDTAEPAPTTELSLEPEPEVELEPNNDEQFDTSSSQRLQALREINGAVAPPGAPTTPEPAEDIVMATANDDPPPSDSVDSIEDQINTSMTQTLKALSVHSANIDDDDEDAPKKGFFGGLFKKK
ncbi:MAG: AAA family ATPase [Pseudomonadota bacterium]